MGDLKPVLSVCKKSEKYSFPKKPRLIGSSSKEKVDGPNPQYYKNTNEIAAKVTLKRNGCYSMGKAPRQGLDPGKWSSMHSSLIAKGIVWVIQESK